MIQLGFILARVLIYVSNITSAEGKEANRWLEQCGMNDIIYLIRFAFESHTFWTRSHMHYCYCRSGSTRPALLRYLGIIHKAKRSLC